MQLKIDIKNEIEEAKLGRFHWKIAILIGIIMFFDGYDLFSAAYVIPLIMKTWKPSGAEIGLMLSSGIVGLSLGSVLQGMMADRMGRRKVILIALYLLSLSNILLATIVNSPMEFALFRLIMGTSLGMITPLAIAYINEWTPRKVANVYSTWVFIVGFSIGGVCSGAAGIFLTPLWGWEGLYFMGALTVIAAIAAHIALPESIQFLALKGADERIRELLGKLRPERVMAYRSAIFKKPTQTVKAGSILVLFSSTYRRNTIVVWIAGALSLFCIQGLTGWLPSIMVQRGEAMSSAFAYGSLLMFASMFGGIGSGWFADKVGSRAKAMLVLYLIAAASLLALGFSSGRVMTISLVAISGFFVFGAQSVLNNFIAMSYKTEVRTTGIGIAIGINRIGGVLGPMAIGAIHGWNSNPIYAFWAFALAMIVAGLCFVFAKTEITKSTDVEQPGDELGTQTA